MKKRWLIGLGAVLAAGSLAAAAAADAGCRGWGGGPGWGRGPSGGPCWGGPGAGPGAGWRQAPESQLPPEEAQKLSQLRQKHWQDMAPLREQVWAKKQELWNLRSQPNTDMASVSKLQKEIFDLRSAMREKGFAFHQEAQKIDPNLSWGGGHGGMGRGWGGGPWGHGGARGGGPGCRFN